MTAEPAAVAPDALHGSCPRSGSRAPDGSTCCGSWRVGVFRALPPPGRRPAAPCLDRQPPALHGVLVITSCVWRVAGCPGGALTSLAARWSTCRWCSPPVGDLPDEPARAASRASRSVYVSSVILAALSLQNWYNLAHRGRRRPFEVLLHAPRRRERGRDDLHRDAPRAERGRVLLRADAPGPLVGRVERNMTTSARGARAAPERMASLARWRRASRTRSTRRSRT